jgi:hypothetical protein
MPLHGQERPATPIPIAVPSHEFRLVNHEPTLSSRLSGSGTSYWAEGGGIGAGLIGLLGVLSAASLCSTSDNVQDSCFGSVVAFGLLGAGVGFTVGAIVGARFPKR